MCETWLSLTVVLFYSTPDSTRQVERPPFLPNMMSVSKRSPTMQICTVCVCIIVQRGALRMSLLNLLCRAVAHHADLHGVFLAERWDSCTPSVATAKEL